MRYEITKEQILELDNLIAGTNLQVWFPEAFKTELELGKWYIASCYTTNGYLVLATEITDNNQLRSNCWFSPGENYVDYRGLFDRVERLATPEEVEAALINEAKKRGFVDGAKFRSFEKGNPIRTINGNGYSGFSSDLNIFIIGTSKKEWENYNSNPAIFKDGKWAEILPQEKTVVPMEKALKIIAKKMKISPENIEIKS